MPLTVHPERLADPVRPPPLSLAQALQLAREGPAALRRDRPRTGGARPAPTAPDDAESADEGDDEGDPR